MVDRLTARGHLRCDGDDVGDARHAELPHDEDEQRRRGWLLVTLGVLVSALAVAVPFVLSTRASGSTDGPAAAGDGTGPQWIS